MTPEQQAILERVQLPNDWKQALAPALISENMDKLRDFLKMQYHQQKKIFIPQKNQIFNAFHLTPLSQVKVVILGQDPYHGIGQAMGLSFSVPKLIPKPPSLQNILKELSNDLGVPISRHGDLSFWAKQGVLLLNATLTVEAGLAGSHQKTRLGGVH